MMDGDEKNCCALDDKGMEEYDHGFDQFLGEEEIDINTFVLPPLPKCSICDAPYPIEAGLILLKRCCGNCICRACNESTYYGELKRRIEDEPNIAINLSLDILLKCPFCRQTPVPSTIPVRESLEILVRRGNNEAMLQLAILCIDGELPHDEKRGVELHHLAARAGNMRACLQLGDKYYFGRTFDDIVIRKDLAKAKRLYTRGARMGDPRCLINLGAMRYKDGQDDYAQYFLKAASTGYQPALDEAKKGFIFKRVTKEEYATALRSFQAAVDKVNNEERKRFSKRLASHKTLEFIELMTKERQVEVLNEILGRTDLVLDKSCLK